MRTVHAHRPKRSNPLADLLVLGIWLGVFIALTATQGA